MPAQQPSYTLWPPPSAFFCRLKHQLCYFVVSLGILGKQQDECYAMYKTKGKGLQTTYANQGQEHVGKMPLATNKRHSWLCEAEGKVG